MAATSTSRSSVGSRVVGLAAVGGVIVAFSLSSTLVKRAETPGALIAFWRMLMVAATWNLLLAARGGRVRLADLRVTVVPGLFLGLNLAVFFLGVTHNSVANAALIGSLAPLLIVPLGERLFGEHMDRRALVFAALSLVGLAVVLFNAPAAGDASLLGNTLGVVAMVLWTGYVVATRHYRRSMDVTTFMASVTPLAALATLPIAVANGDLFGLTATGWTYTAILAFLVGIAGHGLMVFAQRTVEIGTIGIAQVVQPALAAVWSFALLGETVNGAQVVGIVLSIVGLAAFLWLNERGRRTAVAPSPTGDPPGPPR